MRSDRTEAVRRAARPRAARGLAWLLALAAPLGGLAPFGLARAEPVGQVAALPDPPGPHRVWMADLMLRRAGLWDADSGRLLGSLSAGLGIIAPHVARHGREIYLAETHYARGTRGARTDVVTIYDASSLRPLAEVVIPPKRGEHTSGVAASALSDDDRFLAVFNLTPATSLSIVDTRERRFAGEIPTAGCALVYAAGARRFAMLCGDGALLLVTLDEDGRERDRTRSAPFFDPLRDPVTEKGVRYGDRWLFVSFDGLVHGVDLAGEEPRFEQPWSLLAADDRAASWRIGGQQHLALHAASARLFCLVHQGGIDTYKQAGTEVWVYDLARRERVQRIPLRNPTAGFVRQSLELGLEGFWERRLDGLLQRALPHPGIDRIQVTQDDRPLLLSASGFPATLAVHDALTGEFLREFDEAGLAGSLLLAP